MRLKFIYAALAAAPVALLAFSTGPPIKRTGTIDGGLDCTACHRSFAPANSDPRGSVKIENLTNYSPGTVQNLRVTIAHPEGARWGFQLTARFVTGGGMAGSFAPVNEETKVVCDDGSLVGSAGPCRADQFSWIEHSNAVRTATGAGKSYEFQWTPPADENGDIVFYFAANAADGSASNVGDRVYTGTQKISLSETASCPISRTPTLRSVVNAGPHAGPIAPGAMAEVYGSDFQSGSRTRIVGAGDLGAGRFPKELSCIAVEIDGQRAPVTYVQQDQINIQVPNITKTGPVEVRVIANPGRPNELRSPVATITVQSIAPSFFTFGTSGSIAAQFAGTANTVANPSVVPGASPAKPGDVVTLYGSGFGTTNPSVAAGDLATGLSPLVASPVVTIGGVSVPSADVQYIGLAPQSISGLYQLNVKIPASVADGDQPVVLTIGGVQSSSATLPIKR